MWFWLLMGWVWLITGVAVLLMGDMDRSVVFFGFAMACLAVNDILEKLK